MAVGRVLRPHGVRGDLLIEAAPDLVRMLEAGQEVYLGPARRAVRVRSLRRHGRQHLLSLESCGDRPAAEAWRGHAILVRVADLPSLEPGTYYHWQILGLRVLDEQDQARGVIAEILQTGANDVYVVRAAGRPDLLLPAIAEVVLSVDLAAQEMRVHILPGLEPSPTDAAPPSE